MALLHLLDLHVYYGSIHALRGLSIEVDAGKIVTLIGANGAGKSTTLNTISGLLRPRRGSVRLEGEDLTGVPPHEIVFKGIVQVPEGRRIFGRRSWWSRSSTPFRTSTGRAPPSCSSSRTPIWRSPSPTGGTCCRRGALCWPARPPTCRPTPR